MSFGKDNSINIRISVLIKTVMGLLKQNSLRYDNTAVFMILITQFRVTDE